MVWGLAHSYVGEDGRTPSTVSDLPWQSFGFQVRKTAALTGHCIHAHRGNRQGRKLPINFTTPHVEKGTWQGLRLHKDWRSLQVCLGFQDPLEEQS